MRAPTGDGDATSGIGHLGRRRAWRGVPVRVMLAVGLASLVLCAAIPSRSSAESLASRAVTSTISTIDSRASTTGPIVIGTNGWAYVAWEHPSTGDKPATVLFCAIAPGSTCKHTVTLPIPGDEWDVTQPYPVLGGKAGVVYVVGPRYVPDDTVIWTSANGGTSFSKGYILGNSYVGDTSVDDVLRIADAKATQDFFAVASDNVGLGFSFTSPLITKCITCSFSFGRRQGSPVRASASAVAAQWRPSGTTPTPQRSATTGRNTMTSPWPSAWNGPVSVSKGLNARITSGPKGLFLLTQDYAGHESQPTRLDVRQMGLRHAQVRLSRDRRERQLDQRLRPRRRLRRGFAHRSALCRLGGLDFQGRCRPAVDLG